MLATDLRLGLDPATFAESLGFEPDEWQRRALRWSGRRAVWLCARQTGKSTTAAILGLHRALYAPGALVLLVSPSLRQSSEIFRKVAGLLDQLEVRPELLEDNKLSLTLASGSRVLSLPSSEATVRGFSAPDLIVEDESARVSDELHAALTPMQATSANGQLILMSTPFGRRGHFFRTWESGGEAWERIRVTAEECARISPAFLEEERRSMDSWNFEQEFGGRAGGAHRPAAFHGWLAMSPTRWQMRGNRMVEVTEPEPSRLGSLYFNYRESPSFYVGLDLGQHVDPSAAVVLEEAVWIPTRDDVDTTAVHPSDLAGWVWPSQLVPTQRAHFRKLGWGEGRPADPPLAVRLIRRWPLGTKYDQVADDVTTLLGRDPLCLHPTELVVDTGGVGNAVRELLWARGMYHVAVQITAGHRPEGIWDSQWEQFSVAKAVLILSAKLALEQRRLRIDRNDPLAGVLVKELEAFEYKITAAANVQFNARAGAHDDVVLSLALATWLRSHKNRDVDAAMAARQRAPR
jgi:hypothetical protein